MVLESEESRPGDPWETLPIEFLINVLRDLPVSALVACRLVCKRWMEIVDGPELQNEIWNGHVPVFYETDGTAYFCCSDQWITRNITFSSKRLVAADGGLLCFSNHVSTEYVLYNPVSDKFLTLNVPHEIDEIPTIIKGMMECKVVGLVVDRSTKHFKLLLGGVVLPDEHRSLIYDSTTSTWSWLSDKFPYSLKLFWKVFWEGGKSVACGGCLYWLAWNRDERLRALLMFDLRKEEWVHSIWPLLKNEPSSLHVAEYEGRAFLFAMNWFPIDRVFDRRSNYSALLSHPMVRAVDGALIGRSQEQWDTGELWEGEEGRPFRLHPASRSDDFMVFLSVPPFCEVHDFLRFLGNLRRDVRDQFCAMIPMPGVSAGQEWIGQPQREPQEVVEVPRGEAAPEAQAGGQEVQEGPGNEDAVNPCALENVNRSLFSALTINSE